jgi:hypothetical protein
MLSFFHSSEFGGSETSLVSFGSPLVGLENNQPNALNLVFLFIPYNLHTQDIHHMEIRQVSELTETVLNQNYFQYNVNCYTPTKGIAMGFPLSSMVTELQYFEELIIKHWLETKEIVYYKRYVDDILIIFDQNRSDVNTINT